MRKQGLIALSLFSLLFFGVSDSSLAQTKRATKPAANKKATVQKKAPARAKALPKKNTKAPQKPAPKSKTPARPATQVANTSKATQFKNELNAALDLVKLKKYEEASIQLFNLSRSPRHVKERMQIKYILGLVLYDMKMYQASAFQLVDVVRDGNPLYINKSLEKLSLAADALGDETLLNYALSKARVSDFPMASQNLLKYRIGEFQFKSNQLSNAASNFASVTEGSPLFAKSKYMEGLSYAVQEKNDLAIRAFSDLLNYRNKAEFTDVTRVSAQMGLARSYYQNKEWDSSIQTYRGIPRDTPQWHDALFEISWAQMRSAKFRSVLGNMHSLHSPYYEDVYLPESLLLRALVYLYICQYDEMEKTLDLFKKVYMPVRISMRDVLKANLTPNRYFREMDRFTKEYDGLLKKDLDRKSLMLPFLVLRKISKESDFVKSYSYILKLREEMDILNKMGAGWKSSPLGKYSNQVLGRRISRAEEATGVIAKRYAQEIHRDLLELFKQHDFARFEMSNGKKDLLKKKILSKNEGESHIDSESDRNFYVQNGYEYWPFQGEYWLDEIGNYYYLGKPRCE